METTYRKGTLNDCDTLADLHLKAFDNFFMASLGKYFLLKYYRAVLKTPETICLFAEDDSGKMIGFVVGRTNTEGYLKRVLKKNIFSFIPVGVMLLFNHPQRLIRLYKNLKKKNEQIENQQNYAEIGLIGVSPEFKGLGIGRSLLNRVESILKQSNVNRLSLTTDFYNNEDTLAAYQKWGFEVYYEFIAYPNRRMYRLIKILD